METQLKRRREDATLDPAEAAVAGLLERTAAAATVAGLVLEAAGCVRCEDCCSGHSCSDPATAADAGGMRHASAAAAAAAIEAVDYREALHHQAAFLLAQANSAETHADAAEYRRQHVALLAEADAEAEAAAEALAEAQAGVEDATAGRVYTATIYHHYIALYILVLYTTCCI